MARSSSPHLLRDRGAFAGGNERNQTTMLISSGPCQTVSQQVLVEQGASVLKM